MNFSRTLEKLQIFAIKCHTFTWLFLVGMVVFLVMSLVITPPRVSMPNDRGVTSSSSTSVTSPARTAPWMAAPIATASSGFTAFEGCFPKICKEKTMTLLSSFLSVKIVQFYTQKLFFNVCFDRENKGRWWIFQSIGELINLKKNDQASEKHREYLKTKWPLAQ